MAGSPEKVAEHVQNILSGRQSGFYTSLDQAQSDVQEAIRRGTDFFDSFVAGVEIDKDNFEVNQSKKQYDKLSPYLRSGGQPIYDGVQAGNILPGSDDWRKLEKYNPAGVSQYQQIKKQNGKRKDVQNRCLVKNQNVLYELSHKKQNVKHLKWMKSALKNVIKYTYLGILSPTKNLIITLFYIIE